MADGPHIKVTLNGTVITDADLSKIEKTLDHHGPSRAPQRQGLHRWLGHGNPPDPVEFRNIRIKELP